MFCNNGKSASAQWISCTFTFDAHHPSFIYSALESPLSCCQPHSVCSQLLSPRQPCSLCSASSPPPLAVHAAQPLMPAVFAEEARICTNYGSAILLELTFNACSASCCPNHGFCPQLMALASRGQFVLTVHAICILRLSQSPPFPARSSHHCPLAHPTIDRSLIPPLPAHSSHPLRTQHAH